MQKSTQPSNAQLWNCVKGHGSQVKGPSMANNVVLDCNPKYKINNNESILIERSDYSK